MALAYFLLLLLDRVCKAFALLGAAELGMLLEWPLRQELQAPGCGGQTVGKDSTWTSLLSASASQSLGLWSHALAIWRGDVIISEVPATGLALCVCLLILLLYR